MNLSQTLTLLEKNHYPFRKYPKAPCGTVLFPGCSFPAQFPKTMETLAALCRTRGVGVAYDCCGKPVAELGRENSAARIAGEISARLERLGATELVCLCPNCLDYLQETLPVPVISVYALLRRWGVQPPNEPVSGVVFRPCPDRKEGRMLAELAALLPSDGLRPLEGVPCCGLRGDIAAHGKAAGAQLCAVAQKNAAGETLYTYCASCAGQFQRHGCGEVRHLLSALLGVTESPDATHALWNRARMKFKQG